MTTAVTDEDTTNVTVKVTATDIPTGTLYQDPDNPDKIRRQIVENSNYNKSDIRCYLKYNVYKYALWKCNEKCCNHACLLEDLTVIEYILCCIYN